MQRSGEIGPGMASDTAVRRSIIVFTSFTGPLPRDFIVGDDR